MVLDLNSVTVSIFKTRGYLKEINSNGSYLLTALCINIKHKQNMLRYQATDKKKKYMAFK